MAGRIKIPEKIKEDIGYRSVIKGESREEIASKYGITTKTVSKYAVLYRDKNGASVIQEKKESAFKEDWNKARFMLNPNAKKRGD